MYSSEAFWPKFLCRVAISERQILQSRRCFAPNRCLEVIIEDSGAVAPGNLVNSDLTGRNGRKYQEHRIAFHPSSGSNLSLPLMPRVSFINLTDTRNSVFTELHHFVENSFVKATIKLVENCANNSSREYLFTHSSCNESACTMQWNKKNKSEAKVRRDEDCIKV